MSKRKKNKKNKKINVEIENNAVEEAVSEDVETVSNDVIEDYDDMTMLVNDTDEVEEVAEDNGPATELVDDEAEVAEESTEEATEEVTDEVEDAANEVEEASEEAEEIVEEADESAEEIEESAEEVAEDVVEEPVNEEEEAADETAEDYEDMTILVDEPEAEEPAEEVEEPVEDEVNEVEEEVVEESDEPAEEVEEAIEEPVEEVEEAVEEEAEEPAAKNVPQDGVAVPVKTPTPGISVAFYIIGLVFLLVSLFMLFTAISYTKMYLESYDATFADMWSNSIQYVLEHFIPYVGFGIISIGLGKAIKEFRAGRAPNVDKLVNELKSAKEDVSGSFQSSAETVNAAVESINVAAEAVKAMVPPVAEPEPVKEAPEEEPEKNEEDETSFKLFELSKEIEALMEVMNIKFEETEKRQKYRLDEKLEENKKFLSDELASLKEARAEKENALLAEVARIADRFNMDYDLDDDDDEDDDDIIEKRERHFIK